MPDRKAQPITDMHKLVAREVDQRVCRTETLVREENAKTRKEIVELKDLVVELQGSRVHCVIQYALIAAIILSMIFIQGC
jgi:hypothetical protein